MVPSTVVMPREGSLALAFLGKVRNVHEAAFAVAAGRQSFALNRISEVVLIIYYYVSPRPSHCALMKYFCCSAAAPKERASKDSVTCSPAREGDIWQRMS